VETLTNLAADRFYTVREAVGVVSSTRPEPGQAKAAIIMASEKNEGGSALKNRGQAAAKVCHRKGSQQQAGFALILLLARGRFVCRLALA